MTNERAKVGARIQRAVLLRGRALLSVLCFLCAFVVPVRLLRGGSSLVTWRKEATGFEADPGATDRPLPVGSLQKPFVAKAWAAAHPGETPPRVLCDDAAGCWLRAGHGEVGLVRALAVSCNTYFHRLAAATPPAGLAATLTSEGFAVPQPVTPETAIGLPGPEGLVRIRPSTLLDAYSRLVRTPWPIGEPIRQQVLAGLREAAQRGGTAAGLGRWGYWAKTGTVGALDGSPLRTSGLALAVDDTGWAILGLLNPGTGREAAAALAGPLSQLRPWSVAAPRITHALPTSEQRAAGSASQVSSASFRPAARSAVTVRLFDLLAPRRLLVRNLGPSPIAASGGYLGPGATVALEPGQQIGPGLLEIQAPELGLSRRLRARIACERGGRGLVRLTASMEVREYVAGVMAAELAESPSGRRTELGAAVLRFLAQGPRHPDADVCDTTHCAWFVGQGPRVSWPAPHQARLLQSGGDAPAIVVDDAEWDRILDASRQPGPGLWTSHCGGHPLSPQALWGNGDGDAAACPRHRGSETRPWVREWTAAAIEQAFGAPVREIRIESEAGVWVLRAAGPQTSRALRYDDAHRLLARVLGWGALPSPADRVEAVPGGFRAQGVGLGHRVGLCLGD